jgi:hypothetical protein
MKTTIREAFPRALGILHQSQQEGVDAKNLAMLASLLQPEEFLVVKEALELVSAADKILLVEYHEVSESIANTLFLLPTYRYQSASSLYSTCLNRFYHNTALVMDATKSVLLHSLLQGISLVIFQIVLRRRHNMSAQPHLVFVLEYHWRSIHGKLLVFFTLIF